MRRDPNTGGNTAEQRRRMNNVARSHDDLLAQCKTCTGQGMLRAPEMLLRQAQKVGQKVPYWYPCGECGGAGYIATDKLRALNAALLHMRAAGALMADADGQDG